MSKFILAFHGGIQFKTPEDGAAHMVKWKQWNQGLGDAVVDPGMPVGPSKTVTADGVVDDGGSNPISGITILQADTFEAVLEMAGRCPHVDIGGTIEVAEAMQMDV
ncbi:MAG: hypothetical protein V3T17_01705 [Pseudomonadales bacterium]